MPLVPSGDLQPPSGPVGPAGPPQTTEDATKDGQASLEKAWRLLMLRIGKHNPALYQSGGHALDTVNTLMRTHR